MITEGQDFKVGHCCSCGVSFAVYSRLRPTDGRVIRRYSDGRCVGRPNSGFYDIAVSAECEGCHRAIRLQDYTGWKRYSPRRISCRDCLLGLDLELTESERRSVLATYFRRSNDPFRDLDWCHRPSHFDRTDEWNHVAAHLTEALTLKGDYSSTLLAAEALREMGEFEQSIRTSERLLQEYPEFSGNNGVHQLLTMSRAKDSRVFRLDGLIF